jgi:hypothetical protein
VQNDQRRLDDATLRLAPRGAPLRALRHRIRDRSLPAVRGEKQGGTVMLRGLSSDDLPCGGSVVGDREVTALVDAPPRLLAQWMRARVAAWRRVHRAQSDAAAPAIAAWEVIRGR